MSTGATHVDDGSGLPEEQRAAGEPSRRRFLRSAVAGVSLAGALPVVSSALSGDAALSRKGSKASNRARQRGAERDSLEQVLQRYGSELGGITHID